MELSMRKSRYGISYVKNIAAQAGVAMVENNPDEDSLGVDCFIPFGVGTARIQVKCLGGHDLSDLGDFRVDLKKAWIEKWSQCLEPVYLVAVLLSDDDYAGWIKHSDMDTLHKSTAYWVRINQLGSVSSVRIPKSTGNRLSIEAFNIFKDDCLAGYSGVDVP